MSPTDVPRAVERTARSRTADGLVDHLTVVRGSAQTLLEREVDEPVRRQLLLAIVTASAELEHATLAILRQSPHRPTWVCR